MEPVGKADLENCLCVLVSEQSNIVLCPCAVGGGESLEAKSHCCHKKVVAWWHINTSHHFYIPPWSPEAVVNAYVVDLVLQDVVRRYPCGLMHACVERCCLLSPVGSGRTGLKSTHHFHSSVPVHVSPWCPHSLCCPFWSWRWNLPSVWLCPLLLFCLTLLVVVGRSHLSSLLLCIIGTSIALDDVQPHVFLLGGKLGCDDPGVGRLPADESGMCLWCQHQGHTLSTGGPHPRCVLSTAAVLQMKASAVLTVATLSHSVPALRSYGFSLLLLPGWSFLSHTSSWCSMWLLSLMSCMSERESALQLPFGFHCTAS